MNDIKIFSVSETHLHRGENISDKVHAFYEWESTPRSTGRAWGGTGIFVHRSIRFENITECFSVDLEFTVLSFTYEGLTHCFCSVYLPQTKFSEISRFLALVDLLLAQRVDVLLIFGDFNAWHVAWGDCNNKRGNSLLSGLVQWGLGVKRCDGPTRFGQGDQKTRMLIC